MRRCTHNENRTGYHYSPVITEKSMSGIADKKYTFKVAKDANKIEIAEAVAKLFKVKVAKVNTMNVRGRKDAWAVTAATPLPGKRQ